MMYTYTYAYIHRSCSPRWRRSSTATSRTPHKLVNISHHIFLCQHSIWYTLHYTTLYYTIISNPIPLYSIILYTTLFSSIKLYDVICYCVLHSIILIILYCTILYTILLHWIMLCYTLVYTTLKDAIKTEAEALASYEKLKAMWYTYIYIYIWARAFNGTRAALDWVRVCIPTLYRPSAGLYQFYKSDNFPIPSYTDPLSSPFYISPPCAELSLMCPPFATL